jgi:TonB family protein
VTRPVLIHKVNPKYTPEARDARIEGVTVLSAEVWPDGATHNIRVVRTLDPGLDQEATTAASKWKFRPGIKDGVPVKVAVTLEVKFRLR